MLWCPEEDSNLHDVTRVDLNHVRLPIPPSGHSGCGASWRGSERLSTAAHEKGQKVLPSAPEQILNLTVLLSCRP